MYALERLLDLVGGEPLLHQELALLLVRRAPHLRTALPRLRKP
jgi:hypothetical protein